MDSPIYWILGLIGAYIGLCLGMRLLAYVLNAMAERTRQRTNEEVKLQHALFRASLSLRGRPGTRS